MTPPVVTPPVAEEPSEEIKAIVNKEKAIRTCECPPWCPHSDDCPAVQYTIELTLTAEEIEEIQDSLRRLTGTDDSIEGILNSAEIALDEARMALADRNAPAVERALGRAYSAIVEADPSTQVRSSEARATGDLLDEVPLVDLSEEE